MSCLKVIGRRSSFAPLRDGIIIVWHDLGVLLKQLEERILVRRRHYHIVGPKQLLTRLADKAASIKVGW